MALPKDFLHHLHELMVEVSESLREDAKAHKNQLTFDAQRKNNPSAVLAAHMGAELDAFQTRAEKTAERYIDALNVWGLELNDSVEREMLAQIDLLLSPPKRLNLPPGLKHAPNTQATQSEYARELDRTAKAIRRKAANRLREAKIGREHSITTGRDNGVSGTMRGQESGSHRRLQEKQLTRRSATVFNVLIASPSDVSDEREVVTKAINDWNAAHFSSTGIILHAVRWETHSYPASGDRPQSIINRQIVESGDILIGIFGYKLGTPTGEAQSGTIEEIEEFRNAGKYVALYFSTADVPRTADRLQLDALEAYKKERQKDTLYFEFENSQTLRDHLIRHLPKIVQDVREAIDLPDPVQGRTEGPSRPESPASAPEQPAIQSATLLADLISELEDNLDCASRPRAGDVYRRPSVRVWLENRNRVDLAAGIRSQVQTAYNQIKTWADIVSSGLSPNLGNMQLDLTVSDLRMSLPSLIHQLRTLQGAQKATGLSDQGTIRALDWERMAEKISSSCRFIRADSQWTSVTRSESWRIAGGNTGMCQALLREAGAMLLKSPNVRAGMSEEAASEKDNLSRWLLYLKQRGFHETHFPAYEELEDGTKITHVMGGIKDLPQNSAQVCIECAALEI